MDVVKGDLGLIALTPERECNKTAMGLPPDTSAVFVIGKYYVIIYM
jgi:hypothetical protein